MKFIINLSYGASSYISAKRIIKKEGKENCISIFADTKYEDEDTYKWGKAASNLLGIPHIVLADGRSIWELFLEKGYIGNSRNTPCSLELKRNVIDAYLRNHHMPCLYGPWPFVMVFGIHWSEKDRWYRIDRETKEPKGIKARLNKMGISCIAPLCDPPFISIRDMHNEIKKDGLWTQKLYKLGFPHANCGGRCVKQGAGGWALLYKTMPDRFIETMEEENKLRKILKRRYGKEYAMCSEVVNGEKIGLPLIEIKKRIDRSPKLIDWSSFGGCSCFAGDD